MVCRSFANTAICFPKTYGDVMQPALDQIGHCPKCNADWDAGPIPEQYRKYYAPPYRFSRLISIYDRWQDRTVAHKCPDCGETFTPKGVPVLDIPGRV